MSQIEKSAQREEVVVSKAIENIFRKIIRFLLGRISLVKLQEMIRFIYIEEAENKLRLENPTKNVSLTKLAVLSGLDTRTLTKIRNSKNYKQPLHKEDKFLENLTPGASILDVWSSKPPYFDDVTGKPNELNISGSPPSFESLFFETIKSRGVTFKSLLNRLIESNSISVDKKTRKVSLVTQSYLPTTSSDKLGAIEMGFSAIGNLVDTVVNNISGVNTKSDPLYQQGAWTLRLNPENRDPLRNALRKVLERTDKEARKTIEKYEDETASTGQITAGVSVFYFEEVKTN